MQYNKEKNLTSDWEGASLNKKRGNLTQNWKLPFSKT
jgi:hypothetical protein